MDNPKGWQSCDINSDNQCKVEIVFPTPQEALEFYAEFAGVVILPESKPSVSSESTHAFKQWWTTKVAEGYQYGREPLANVEFGFKAGFAAALAKENQ